MRFHLYLLCRFNGKCRDNKQITNKRGVFCVADYPCGQQQFPDGNNPHGYRGKKQEASPQ